MLEVFCINKGLKRKDEDGMFLSSRGFSFFESAVDGSAPRKGTFFFFFFNLGDRSFIEQED